MTNPLNFLLVSTHPRPFGFKKNVEVDQENPSLTKRNLDGLYKDPLPQHQGAKLALTLFRNLSSHNCNVCGLQISRKGNTMKNSYLLLRTKKLSD